MSLLVWLPFTDGTLKQQGNHSSTISVNGTTSFGNGKLGQALNCNGSTYWLIPGLSLGDNVTIMCWSKTTINGKMSWVLESNASNLLNFYESSIYTLNTGDSNNNPFKDDNGANINCLHDGEWHHFAVTWNGTSCLLYIDGEYRGKAQNYRSPASGTSTKPLKIAGGYKNAHSYDWNGMINDFRLYDDCLSEKEIHRIAQGLIVHYPLDNMGCGNENLFNANNWTSSSSVITKISMSSMSVGQDSYLENKNSYPLSTGHGVLTFSAICETLSLTNANARLDLRTNNNRSCPIPLKSVGYRQKIILEIPSTSTYICFGGWGYSGRVLITNMKLEEGNIVTPFCPNKEDENYSNIEYDYSGFNNNGIRHGDFSHTSNTPKYIVSTTATGSSTTYLEGVPLPTEAKTVALWIKNTNKANNDAIFNDKNSGLQIGLLNSLLFINSKASTAGFTTTNWINGEWNHVVAINDNGVRSVYVNGKPEIQSSTSNYYVHNANNFWLWNRSYNNNYPFEGSLCDLRIYATALSPEDVKSLYQNCVTIDSDGIIRGQLRS